MTGDEFARPGGREPLRVSGVAVHPPLTERQAGRLAPLGLLADDPVGLRAAWAQIKDMWRLTVERAMRLPPTLLDERVDGEWSFLETLRHLVFVSDGWVGEVVLEDVPPYEPLGMPPDFVTNGAEMGLDLGAKPGADVVRARRDLSMARVGRVIDSLNESDLSRTCAPKGGQWTVLGALQVVIFEEWAHNQYAVRDLARLEGSA